MEAYQLHHRPLDGLCCGLCAGERDGPQGWRSSLLHHRQETRGNRREADIEVLLFPLAQEQRLDCGDTMLIV